jgi:hypothetical protein
MEEDTAPSRRNDTLLLGGMEPLVPPRHSTQSSAPPPYVLWYSDGFIIMTEEDGKKLARLGKRLVANIDFNDQGL